MNELCKTINLQVGYGSASLLLKDLNLTIPGGQIICLLGANGSGKTTLLKTLCGLIPPLDGDIYLNQKNLSAISLSRRAQIISFMQTPKNELTISVKELVRMGRYPYSNFLGSLDQTDLAIADQELAYWGLTTLQDKKISDLSDGEASRAHMAKLMAQNTPLALLDEPLAFLDPPNKVETLARLKERSRSEDRTFLITIHDLPLALRFADTLWLLMPDKTLVGGAPEDLAFHGYLDKIFSGHKSKFDLLTGDWQLQDQNPIPCSLETNDQLSRVLAQKLLWRTGFKEDPGAPIKLIQSPQKDQNWSVLNNSHENKANSFAELAQILEHIKHNS